MATKKLTEKQEAKVKAIAAAAFIEDPLNAKNLKLVRKVHADKIKAIDKILAIICPPVKAKE
jgi:hypothetical protein